MQIEGLDMNCYHVFSFTLLLFSFSLSGETSFNKQTQQILKDFRINNSNFSFDTAEVNLQEIKFPAKLNFHKALFTALKTMFNDKQDQEAPLNLVQETFFDFREGLSKQVKEKLRELLNENTSFMRLVPVVIKDTTPYVYPPENNESLRVNWVFYLKIASLSDHLYWVVVDRNNKENPYIYGFN